jgi:hypothetical protein
MARVFEIEDSTNIPVLKDLTWSFQSGHINFLLGAGASYSAIPLAGNVEAEIDDLLRKGDEDGAKHLIYSLLYSIQSPSNNLIHGSADAACTATFGCYKDLLRTIERILSCRRTSLLPRQATIFTTNYDIFLDLAANACEAAIVANGFARNVISEEPTEYSPRRFFLATYDTGNLFDYRVELPALNIVKLHGCLTWKRAADRIIMCQASRKLPTGSPKLATIKRFLDSYAVVLPTSGKFNTTVLDRTYYELLRLYANALDKENSLLIAFGFSFRDEHILHITLRALKNPTLRLAVVAYDSASRNALETTFASNDNVIVIAARHPETIDFPCFNALLANAAPKSTT